MPQVAAALPCRPRGSDDVAGEGTKQVHAGKLHVCVLVVDLPGYFGGLGWWRPKRSEAAEQSASLRFGLHRRTRAHQMILEGVVGWVEERSDEAHRLASPIILDHENNTTDCYGNHWH